MVHHRTSDMDIASGLSWSWEKYRAPHVVDLYNEIKLTHDYEATFNLPSWSPDAHAYWLAVRTHEHRAAYGCHRYSLCISNPISYFYAKHMLSGIVEGMRDKSFVKHTVSGFIKLTDEGYLLTLIVSCRLCTKHASAPAAFAAPTLPYWRFTDPPGAKRQGWSKDHVTQVIASVADALRTHDPLANHNPVPPPAQVEVSWEPELEAIKELHASRRLEAQARDVFTRAQSHLNEQTESLCEEALALFGRVILEYHPFATEILHAVLNRCSEDEGLRRDFEVLCFMIPHLCERLGRGVPMDPKFHRDHHALGAALAGFDPHLESI